MQPSIERRSVPRVAVNYPVIFYHSAPNTPATKMLDLSVAGAALEAETPFPVGARTSFLFFINGNEVVECTARVITVLPLSDSKYRIGVYFTKLPNEARALVAEMFNLRNSGSVSRPVQQNGASGTM